MTSVDLPPPETPVTQVNRPSGDLDRDVLQVVATRSDDRQRLALRGGRRRAGIAQSARRTDNGRSASSGWPISSGVPSATMSPPWTPAAGPISTT